MTTNSINNTIPNDFTVTKSAAASVVASTVEHLTDAANSQACQIISVAGSTADDPYTRLAIGTTATYALGIDNSDSDKFKITYHADAATPSSTALLNSTIAGEVIEPFQPCFNAQQTGTANVTGNNTTYTMNFATELYDVGANFSGGVFTAPVTGKYLLGANIALGDVDQDGLRYRVFITTSNRDYYATWVRMWAIAVQGEATYFTIHNILADLDSGDTFRMQMNASGGNKTYDAPNGGNSYTYGDLVI